MSGIICHATLLDSIRIDRFTGSAITIPSSFILAIDDVLRAAMYLEESLDVYESAADEWRAYVGNHGGSGATPWGAIISLADNMQWDGQRVLGEVKVLP